MIDEFKSLVKLGHPPSLLAIISTGRNHIQNLVLKLAATGVNFQFQNATNPEGFLIIFYFVNESSRAAT